MGDSARLQQMRAQRAEEEMGRSRKKKRALLITTVLLGISVFLCGGFLPALFTEQTGLGAGNTNPRIVSCEYDSDAADNIPGTTIEDLSKQQRSNAAVIVSVGQQMEVPPWGWVVGVATAMQESKLQNLGHLGAENDHDSIGMFQQRPSQGWGTPAQLMDPNYSSRKFFSKLLTIEGWEEMPLTEAAQKVQRSMYPDAYAKWEALAIQVVNEITSGDTLAEDGVRGNPLCAVPGSISASGWVAPAVGHVGSGFRTSARPQHDGVDVILPRGVEVRAASAGTVTVSECNASTNNCDVDGSPQITGCGWHVEIMHGPGLMTRYCHFEKAPEVSVEDVVTPGQLIGYVGSSGNSSGPHLHFEVHTRTSSDSTLRPVDPELFLASRGAPLRPPS